MGLLQQASLVVTPNAVKAGKLYSIVPTNGAGDLGVVRATSATFVGSNGLIQTASNNIARLDYYNGSCPSILVEPQRTNLILQSDMFEHVTWGKSSSSISANTTISPSGIQNADTFIANGTSNLHAVTQNVSVVSGTTYSYSVYAKKNTNNFIQLTFSVAIFATNVFANFDLNSGVVGTVGAGATASIQSVGNGWYRCTIIATAIATATNLAIVSLVTSTTSPRNETNTLSTSVFLWGAQLEAGENPTSYIPTTTTTVTRNADVISNTNASTLIGQSEGTIFVDYNKVLAPDTPRNIIGFTDGTSNNLIEIWDGVGSDNLGMLVYTCTTNAIFKSTGFGQTTISPSGRYKICLTYSFTPTNMNFKFFVNGVKLRDDNVSFTAFNNPLSRINIGNRNGTFVGVGGHNIDFISKTAITETQAIQLTTL